MSKSHLYICFQPFGVKSSLSSQTERIRRHLSPDFLPVVKPASKTETLKTWTFSEFYKDPTARFNAAKRENRKEGEEKLWRRGVRGGERERERWGEKGKSLLPVQVRVTHGIRPGLYHVGETLRMDGYKTKSQCHPLPLNPKGKHTDCKKPTSQRQMTPERILRFTSSQNWCVK